MGVKAKENITDAKNSVESAIMRLNFALNEINKNRNGIKDIHIINRRIASIIIDLEEIMTKIDEVERALSVK